MKTLQITWFCHKGWLNLKGWEINIKYACPIQNSLLGNILLYKQEKPHTFLRGPRSMKIMGAVAS